MLSQSYNAPVFYFDNISFPRACIKQIISPKQKFNESSILSHNVFNNLFLTVQETNHFVVVGWLKKNEMNGDVPVSDMRHAIRAAKKMSLFLSEFFTFLRDKIFYKCSFLI